MEAMTQRPEPNRWAVLALLGIAQLMVVLDVTIVNIALPSAQRALDFSTENRQWIITAYALAFGSLLLVGGKLGDLFGRKWTFIAGLLGFSVASAAEHDLRRRGVRVRVEPSARTGPAGRGHRPRLHHRVLVGRGCIRARPPDRAARAA